MIQQRNKNNIRDKHFNDFLATNLDATLTERYCTKCHLKLVHNPRNKPADRYIYSCPQCNCTVNIHNTEPSEKILPVFPVTHTSRPQNKPCIIQSNKDNLARSLYFINKRLEEKNEIDNQDPHLAILKQNNNIKITNIEYYDPTED